MVVHQVLPDPLYHNVIVEASPFNNASTCPPWVNMTAKKGVNGANISRRYLADGPSYNCRRLVIAKRGCRLLLLPSFRGPKVLGSLGCPHRDPEGGWRRNA